MAPFYRTCAGCIIWHQSLVQPKDRNTTHHGMYVRIVSSLYLGDVHLLGYLRMLSWTRRIHQPLPQLESVFYTLPSFILCLLGFPLDNGGLSFQQTAATLLKLLFNDLCILRTCCDVSGCLSGPYYSNHYAD